MKTNVLTVRDLKNVISHRAKLFNDIDFISIDNGKMVSGSITITLICRNRKIAYAVADLCREYVGNYIIYSICTGNVCETFNFTFDMSV